MFVVGFSSRTDFVEWEEEEIVVDRQQAERERAKTYPSSRCPAIRH